MSAESLFAEFFEFCSCVLVGENPKILDLIQHRYDDCKDGFRESEEMLHLLAETKRKMEDDESRLFIHLKELTDVLKTNRKIKKKSCGEKKRKRHQKNETNTDKGKSEVCSSLDSIGEEGMSSHISEDERVDAKRRKIQSCSLGDGHIKEAQVIRIYTEGNVNGNDSSPKHSPSVKKHSLSHLSSLSCSKKCVVSLSKTELHGRESSWTDSPPASKRQLFSDSEGVDSALTPTRKMRSEDINVHCTSSPKHTQSTRSVNVVTINDSGDVIHAAGSSSASIKPSIANKSFESKDEGLEKVKPAQVHVAVDELKKGGNSSPQSVSQHATQDESDAEGCRLDLRAESDDSSHSKDESNLSRSRKDVSNPSSIENEFSVLHCPDESEKRADPEIIAENNVEHCEKDINGILDAENEIFHAIADQLQKSPGDGNNMTEKSIVDMEGGIDSNKGDECSASDKFEGNLDMPRSEEGIGNSNSKTLETTSINQCDALGELCLKSNSDAEAHNKSNNDSDDSDASGKDNPQSLNGDGVVNQSEKDTNGVIGEESRNHESLSGLGSEMEVESSTSNSTTSSKRLSLNKVSYSSRLIKDNFHPEVTISTCPGDVSYPIDVSTDDMLDTTKRKTVTTRDESVASGSKGLKPDRSIDDKQLLGNDSDEKAESESDNTASNTDITKHVSASENEKEQRRRIPLVSVEDDAPGGKLSFLVTLSLGSKKDCDDRATQPKEIGVSKDKEKATTSSNPKEDAEQNSADEFTAAQTENFRRVVENAKAKGKKPPSERHIRKLESLLEKLRDEIEKGQEMTLEELDQEDSYYIYEDKLKKKFVAAWTKLCEITDRTVTTGRPTERTIHYDGTRYREINRRLEKFLNKRKQFPDFQDIKTIIKLTNTKCNLHLSAQMMNDLAREAFVDIGEMLQTRRHQDFIASFGSSQTDNYSQYCDPAYNDPELRRKLESNRKVGRSNLDAVITKYTELQYTRGTAQADTDDDDDDDDDDDSDENDEGEDEANSKKSMKSKKHKRSGKDKKKTKHRKRRISSSSSDEQVDKEEDKKMESASVEEFTPASSGRTSGQGEEKNLSTPPTVASRDDQRPRQDQEQHHGPNIKFTKRKSPQSMFDAIHLDKESYIDSPLSVDLNSETMPASRMVRSNISMASNPESEDETSESDEDKEDGGDNVDDDRLEDNDDDDLDVLVVSSDSNSDDDDDDDDGSSKCPSPVSVISLGSLSEGEEDSGDVKQPQQLLSSDTVSKGMLSVETFVIEDVRSESNLPHPLSNVSPSVTEIDEGDTVTDVRKHVFMDISNKEDADWENSGATYDSKTKSVTDMRIKQSTPIKNKGTNAVIQDVIVILDTPEKKSSPDVGGSRDGAVDKVVGQNGSVAVVEVERLYIDDDIKDLTGSVTAKRLDGPTDDGEKLDPADNGDASDDDVVVFEENGLLEKVYDGEKISAVKGGKDDVVDFEKDDENINKDEMMRKFRKREKGEECLQSGKKDSESEKEKSKKDLKNGETESSELGELMEDIEAEENGVEADKGIEEKEVRKDGREVNCRALEEEVIEVDAESKMVSDCETEASEREHIDSQRKRTKSINVDSKTKSGKIHGKDGSKLIEVDSESTSERGHMEDIEGDSEKKSEEGHMKDTLEVIELDSENMNEKGHAEDALDVIEVDCENKNEDGLAEVTSEFVEVDPENRLEKGHAEDFSEVIELDSENRSEKRHAKDTSETIEIGSQIKNKKGHAGDPLEVIEVDFENKSEKGCAEGTSEVIEVESEDKSKRGLAEDNSKASKVDSKNKSKEGDWRDSPEVIEMDSENKREEDHAKDDSGVDPGSQSISSQEKDASEREMIDAQSEKVKDCGKNESRKEVIDVDSESRMEKDSKGVGSEQEVIGFEPENKVVEDCMEDSLEKEGVDLNLAIESQSDDDNGNAEDNLVEITTIVDKDEGVKADKVGGEELKLLFGDEGAVGNSEDWKVDVGQDFEVYMDRLEEEEDEEEDVFNSITKLCNSIIKNIDSDDEKHWNEKKDGDDERVGGSSNDRMLTWSQNRSNWKPKGVRIFVTNEGERIDYLEGLENECTTGGQLMSGKLFIDEFSQEDLKFGADTTCQQDLALMQVEKVVKCVRSKEDDRKLVEELMKDVSSSEKGKKRKAGRDELLGDVTKKRRITEDVETDSDLEIVKEEESVPRSIKVARVSLERMSESDILLEMKRIKQEKEDTDDDDLTILPSSSSPMLPSFQYTSSKRPRNVSNAIVGTNTNSKMLRLGPKPNIVLPGSHTRNLPVPRPPVQRNQVGMVSGEKPQTNTPPPKMKGVNWDLIYASLPQAMSPTTSSSLPSSPSAGAVNAQNSRPMPSQQPFSRKNIRTSMPNLPPQHCIGGSAGSSRRVTDRHYNSSSSLQLQPRSILPTQPSNTGQQPVVPLPGAKRHVSNTSSLGSTHFVPYRQSSTNQNQPHYRSRYSHSQSLSPTAMAKTNIRLSRNTNQHNISNNYSYSNVKNFKNIPPSQRPMARHSNIEAQNNPIVSLAPRVPIPRIATSPAVSKVIPHRQTFAIHNRPSYPSPSSTSPSHHLKQIVTNTNHKNSYINRHQPTRPPSLVNNQTRQPVQRPLNPRQIQPRPHQPQTVPKLSSHQRAQQRNAHVAAQQKKMDGLVLVLDDSDDENDDDSGKGHNSQQDKQRSGKDTAATSKSPPSNPSTTSPGLSSSPRSSTVQSLSSTYSPAVGHSHNNSPIQSSMSSSPLSSSPIPTKSSLSTTSSSGTLTNDESPKFKREQKQQKVETSGTKKTGVIVLSDSE